LKKKSLPDATTWGITGDDARHIRIVLRMIPGDELTLCDGHRTDIHARILAVTDDVVELSLGERQENQTESPLEIWLFQGLPKSDKIGRNHPENGRARRQPDHPGRL